MAGIILDEGAAPGTPGAAKTVIYVKADGLVYAKDDAGTEICLGTLTPTFTSVSTGAFTSNGIDDNATENAITISADEEVTMPKQPGFLAQITSTVEDVTGDTTLYSLAAAIWTEIYDQNSDFLNGTFIAPVTGIYHFDFNLAFSGITGNHVNTFIDLVASNRTLRVYSGSPTATVGSGGTITITRSIDVDMDAADTFHVEFYVKDTDRDIDIGTNTWLSGRLVA